MEQYVDREGDTHRDRQADTHKYSCATMRIKENLMCRFYRSFEPDLIYPVYLPLMILDKVLTHVSSVNTFSPRSNTPLSKVLLIQSVVRNHVNIKLHDKEVLCIYNNTS